MWRRRAWALGLMLGVTTFAASCTTSPAPVPPAAGGAVAPVGALAGGASSRLVVLGDSLTAGLGLAPEEAFPSLLQARLREKGLAIDVVYAGVSGDTSAGGLRRLDWSLDGPVRVLVVALGGNDGLRGLPPEELKRNLAAIIERAQKRGITVILAGMDAPHNLGRAYTAAFRQAYRDVATEHRVALLPFLLEGVALVGSLNQADGIHPNAAGARKVADNLWPLVESAARQALSP